MTGAQRVAGEREWPGGAKKYCRFALGKSNMDTQVCCTTLSVLCHPGLVFVSSATPEAVLSGQWECNNMTAHVPKLRWFPFLQRSLSKLATATSIPCCDISSTVQVPAP